MSCFFFSCLPQRDPAEEWASWLDVHAQARVRKKMRHSQSCFCSVNTRKKKRVIPPDGLMNAMEIIDERGTKMQAEAKREVKLARRDKPLCYARRWKQSCRR